MNGLSSRDEDRLRQALQTIAAEAEASTARFGGHGLRWAAAAAVLLLAGGVTTLVLDQSDGPRPPSQAIATPSPPAPVSSGGAAIGLTYDLDRLVKEAPHVVVGEVSEIRRGTGEGAGGIPTVLAHVRVRESLRGGAGEVWAFDYDLGGGTSISSVPKGAPWRTGMTVLLFLAPSTGTVHEGLAPEHEQVVGGAQGRYEVVDGQLVDAPFTLDQARARLT